MNKVLEQRVYTLVFPVLARPVYHVPGCLFSSGVRVIALHWSSTKKQQQTVRGVGGAVLLPLPARGRENRAHGRHRPLIG